VLRVRDDGVGIPDRPERSSGLANLAQRAEALGGTFSATRDGERGTVVEWRVPLSEVYS
jgi:signal transduction histidine kinase